ncbi:hypothetical protein CQA50_27570 [Escherichia coli]|nr:hypothetical protein CQA50_27570 [Escherichia coli]
MSAIFFFCYFSCCFLYFVVWCNNYSEPVITFIAKWICPYISRHLLSLNPLLARCRRYSRGER